MSLKEQILAKLGGYKSNATIAREVGCTPSYVSKLNRAVDARPRFNSDITKRQHTIIHFIFKYKDGQITIEQVEN